MTGGRRLSLGILAHNEERRIGATLDGLFRQTLFDAAARARLGIAQVEVVCLPNGCTDRTAAVVGAAFAQRQPDTGACRVVSCDRPGKAGAWNTFVHAASDPVADYLMLLDADIAFETGDVLEKLFLGLERNELAVVATDRPVKAIGRARAPLSLKERASLSASAQASTVDAISGQLYCGRAVELRKVWMPLALPVEDGFLAAMIVTDGFSRPRRPGLIIRVEDAVHYFETHGDIAGFLRHERRIIVGSVINAWLFQLLWERGKDGHVGAFIARENRRNPDWVDDHVREEIARRPWWKIPSPFLWRRFSALRGQPLGARLRRAPIAVASTVLTIVACVQANTTLKQAHASRFW